MIVRLNFFQVLFVRKEVLFPKPMHFQRVIGRGAT